MRLRRIPIYNELSIVDIYSTDHTIYNKIFSVYCRYYLTVLISEVYLNIVLVIFCTRYSICLSICNFCVKFVINSLFCSTSSRFLKIYISNTICYFIVNLLI